MNKPIVHAYLMCHNEEKILPHLLRHYSAFCEKIYIVDNMSDDRSVEIINSFDNTEIISYDTKGKFREDLLTGLRNNIWKNSQGIADYVIVGDADEFLYHENMIEFLKESYANGITVFKPVGSHMIGDTELDLKEDDNVFELIKEGVPVDALNKMMMFDCNKISEMNYSFGCHMARPMGEVKLYQDPSLKMLHYKFIGLDNHLKKNKSRGDRLSDYNKKHRLTVYYLYSDEEATNDYMNYLNKRIKIID